MSGEHRYESCHDGGCERKLCEVWREARAEGYQDGFADGFAAGVASAS